MANILFLPGFGGNELVWTDPVSGSVHTLWICPVSLATGLWHCLGLNPDGTGRELWLCPELRAGGPLMAAYRGLFESLTQGGHRIATATVDWRKTFDQNTAQVFAQIEIMAVSEVVTIVCHSRGALQAQAVLSSLATHSKTGLVRRVVCLGGPFGGCYAPIPWLGGWAVPSIPSIALVLGGAWAIGLAIQLLHLRSIITSYPSIYELLPNPSAIPPGSDPGVELLYDAGTWAGQLVPVSSSHLAAARARWSAGPVWPPGVDVRHVVGMGVPTLSGPTNPAKLGGPNAAWGTADGDGVVPLWSALAGGGDAIRLVAGHMDLVQAPGPLAVLGSALV